MTNQEILLRIELLESRSVFQDDLIEILNQAISDQQIEINRLREHLRLLYQRASTVNPSLLASPEEETPPPHY